MNVPCPPSHHLVPSLAAWALAAVLGGCGGTDAAGGGAGAAGSGNGHRLVTLVHTGFQLLYDCDDRIGLRFAYTLERDTGWAARPLVYTQVDPQLPAGCPAQLSAASYARVAPGWDRGHLVPAHHMDGSDAQIAQTFLMSNIVPQRSVFNQGIWQDAAAIAECWRDVAPVQVVGGVVADDPSNDLFRASHGVVTPDWFWMVLVSADPARPGQQRALAWWVPNIDATGTLASRQVTIEALERRLGTGRVGLSGLGTTLKATLGAPWGTRAGC